MKVRRLGQLVPVLVLALGVIGWQAGIGVAGETDPAVEETTTTSTTPLPGSEVEAPPATDTPAAQEDVAALAGPVGYTNGFSNQGIGDCDFFEVDLGTGVLTEKNTDLLPCADGYTFSKAGTLYAYRLPRRGGPGGSSTLITVDPSNGAQTVVGSIPQVFDGGMTFDASGALWLYASSETDDCDFNFCLYKVDPATAATTLVGGQDTRYIGGLAATCTEVQAVSGRAPSGAPSNQLAFDRVNTADGALTTVAPVTGVGDNTGLDYDSAGILWGVGQSLQAGNAVAVAYRIDTATGAATPTTLTEAGNPFFGQIFGLAVAGTSCVELQPTFTG